MAEDTGFIVLYRSLLKWEWYDDSNTMRLFVHLLLLANHADKKWHGTTVERGQVVTSIGHLSRDLKITKQSIRTSLEHLKSTGEITIQATNKYSLVTVANYGVYQDVNEKSTRKVTRKATFNQQSTNNQLTTNNNDNNENNINNIGESCFQSEVEKAMASFIDCRMKLKKPMTERAIDLAWEKLRSLSTDENEQIQIINQSILRGWSGLFPIKQTEVTKTDSKVIYRDL